MAIFVIGYKDNGSDERLVRLYNDKKKQIKDIKESDLLFLMEDINIVNAELKNKKLKGTTGSLDKVLNENFFVILGSIMQGDDIVAYRIVNSQGKDEIVDIRDIPSVFNTGIVQNASLVDEKYVRGINWEIPVVEELPEKKVPNGFKEAILLTEKDLKVIKKPRKGQVIMVVDHFNRNSIMSVHNRYLEVVMDSFYLRLTEDMFYKMLLKLSKYQKRLVNLDRYIIVDEKNFVIKVPTLFDILETDIKEIKKICEEYNHKLYLQPLLNFNLDKVKCSSSLEIEELMLMSGAQYGENGNTGEILSKDILKIEEKSFKNNSILPLYSWKFELYHLYYKYFKCLTNKLEIPLILEKQEKRTSIKDKNEYNICFSYIPEILLTTTGSSLRFKGNNKFKNKIADDKIYISIADCLIGTASKYNENKNEIHMEMTNVSYMLELSEKNFLTLFDMYYTNLKKFESSFDVFNFFGNSNRAYLCFSKKGVKDVLKFFSEIGQILNANIVMDLTDLYLDENITDFNWDYIENSLNTIKKDKRYVKIFNDMYKDTLPFFIKCSNFIFKDVMKTFKNLSPSNVKIKGKQSERVDINSEYGINCKLVPVDYMSNKEAIFEIIIS